MDGDDVYGVTAIWPKTMIYVGTSNYHVIICRPAVPTLGPEAGVGACLYFVNKRYSVTWQVPTPNFCK